MKPTLESQIREIFRRIGALEKRLTDAEELIDGNSVSIERERQNTSASIRGLNDRVRGLELSRDEDQARQVANIIDSLPIHADIEADEADGQWGIGDIIFKAEKVETRKSSEENGSPLMCAWFDDLSDAKSLARYVRENVRFDPLTSTHTVTFIATKVI